MTDFWVENSKFGAKKLYIYIYKLQLDFSLKIEVPISARLGSAWKISAQTHQ